MSKFLYQPVHPYIVNQKFGENKACIDLATRSKTITCDGLNPPPGYRSLYGPLGHLAIDLKASHGQPVYCSYEGVVSSIDTKERSGLDVKVFSEFEGKKYRHTYEHLLGYQPKIGDKIGTGDLIGWADNTGYSSGDHLHWQVEQWINGAWVAIDPEPLTFNSFALLQGNQFKQIKESLAVLLEKLSELLRKK